MVEKRFVIFGKKDKKNEKEQRWKSQEEAYCEGFLEAWNTQAQTKKAMEDDGK